MDNQSNDILLEILKEFPYFKKYSSGRNQKGLGTYDLIDFTLDKIINTSADIFEGAVFFYGDQSRYSDIIGASHGIKSLQTKNLKNESSTSQITALWNDYDETRIDIPENSVIHYLNKSKNPLFVNLINYSSCPTKISSIIEYKKHGNTVCGNTISRKLLLNDSLRDSSSVLYFYDNNRKLITVFAAPLGLLSIHEPISSENLIEMNNYGMLTGYAIFYAKDIRSSEGSIEISLINQFERAMQVLWVVCNSIEDFHIYKQERIARENLLGEITHRFNSGLYPILSAIELFKEDNIQDGLNTLKKANLSSLYNFVNFLNSQIGDKTNKIFSIDSIVKSIIIEFESSFPDIRINLQGKGRLIHAFESEITFSIYELINNARRHHANCVIDVDIFTEQNLEKTIDLQKSFKSRKDFEKHKHVLENFVCVTITNDGGIPYKYKESIFESRKRIVENKLISDKGTKPRGQGLYLIKKFIEQNHGGIVFEDGIPNKYARFRIILQTFNR